MNGYIREKYYYGTFELVGMFWRDDRADLKKSIHIGSELDIVRENDNKYDKNAVAVYNKRGHKLGYISRFQNEELASLLDDGLQFTAEVKRLKIKTTGASAILAVFCTNYGYQLHAGIESWKRKTLIEDIMTFDGSNDNENE